MILMLVALVIPAILGFLIVSILLRDETTSGLSERLCMAYPLGMGLVTVQMFLLALVRVSLTLWYVAIPIMIEIVGLYLWIRKSKVVLVKTSSFGLFSEIFGADDHWLKKISLIVLIALVVIKIGSIFVETYLRPIFAWDSFANWSASAKAFYYSHGLLLDALPEDFFGKGLLNRNSNYPPHNPLMQVWMSLWIGHFDEVFVKFWSPIYLLAMSVYLYVFMARETSRLIALSMLVLFLSSPLLSIHSIEAYSDVPLSVYILFSLIMFFFAMRGKYGYWTLMGLFSAEALFTKDEAPFFVLPLLLAAAAFFWQNRGQGPFLRKSAVALLAGLLLAVPWFVFKFSHNLGFGADYVTVEFTLRTEMVWKVFLLLTSFQNFNVFFLFIPILMILSGRPTKEFIFLATPVLCYAMFFILVYTLTAFFSGNLMFNTAIFRNSLTYYPSICLLTALLIKTIMLRWDAPTASLE
jgi:4-amino-4-deoxy-L-arabinose transferase-like glycosyltransferase